MADINTIEWLLINWGRWAYVNRGVSLSYPSIEPYERMRAKPPTGVSHAPQISDDDALAVDKAVAELCAARPREGEALARYYLYSHTYRDLGRKMGKHHKQIADMVQGGKMWVEGRLTEAA